MEDLFMKLQEVKILKDIRSVIDSIGVFNIAIAALVFIYVVLGNFILIPDQVKEMFDKGYLLAVVAMGFMIIQRLIDVLDKTNNDAMQKVVLFMSFLWIYPLLNSRLVLTYFPLFAIISTLVNSYIANRINVPKIKLSNSPPAVADYLNNVFPLILMVFIGLVPFGLYIYLFEYLLVMIIYILSLLSHSLTMFIIIFLICYFWYRGMHGVGVISMLFRPFWFQMIIVNTYTLLTEQTIPYIVSEAFLSWGVWVGGSGATIGLVLGMRLFARSEEMKKLGKEAIPTSFANINENVIFGTPIVQNKYFRIPFFLAPMVMGLLTYTLIFEGYLPHFALVSPWVLPGPIGAFLSSGGSLKMFAFSFILILVSTLIYLPFFLAYDSSLLKAEQVNNE